MLFDNSCFIILFIYFCREDKGGEKERERNINQLPLTGTPTGYQTCNPSMCPDWESNQQLFTLWENTQPIHTSQGDNSCYIYSH